LGHGFLFHLKIKNPESGRLSGHFRFCPALRQGQLVYQPSSIRTVPSAPESHRILRRQALAGFTADWELLALTLPRRLFFCR